MIHDFEARVLLATIQALVKAGNGMRERLEQKDDYDATDMTAVARWNIATGQLS